MNRFNVAACTAAILIASASFPTRAALAHDDRLSQAQSPAAAMQDRVVGIHGGSLFIRCMGSGAPTVVLDDAGFVEEWMTVQPVIARFTRVCSYDRTGLGMSAPGRVPTSTARLAHDLHTLLRQSQVPGPYVLAGHAFGGDTVRLFAGLYPRDTAGLVLVDAIPPAVLSHALIPNGDDVDVPQSRQELNRAGSLHTLPLLVLSHGIPYSYSPRVEQRWPELQRHFAALSSNSRLAVTGSGQDMPTVVPEVVIAAVHLMLTQIASGNAGIH